MSLYLNSIRGVNLYMLYRIIRGIATPFEDTEAYRLGIIDKDGKVLRKRKELDTDEEKAAFTLFDVFIFNIKKILAKVPGANSKLATYTAALFLLKENLIDKDVDLYKTLLVEEIANVVGNGSQVSVDKPTIRKSVRSKFGDKNVFTVSPEIYYSLLKPKPKYHRYHKYVGNGDDGEEIRQFARENPDKDILIKNSNTGSMKYLRSKIRLS